MDEKQYKPKHMGPQEIILQNQFKKVYKVDVDFENFSKEYFVDDCGERVAVLAVQQNQILLVKQYRLLINDLSYELPGGSADRAESFEAAAVRECLEETGIQVKNLLPLFEYHISLDGVKNYTHIYYTNEFDILKQFEANPQEIVDYCWIPIDQCLAMIASKKIMDSMTIIGILYYKAFCI